MRFLALALVSLGMVCAAEEPVPGVEAVISERLKDLPVPSAPDIPKVLTMAISATDAKAQLHTLHGIANLQGSWDFEAYRHFCEALKHDPDCLMAHWGVAMALIDPEPDLLDERQAALRRMVALVNETEEGEAARSTELERSYVYALAVYFERGPAAAAEVFQKAAAKYPGDPQLQLLSAAFGRGGYGDDGQPTPDQEKSETTLRAMLEREPDHPLYLYAYLSMKAEASDLRKDVERARHLCHIAPGYPPFLHLLGHYEWRSGNAAAAADAFGLAAEGYKAWMAATKLTHVDCPGWVKAECYRAAALASRGDYENALGVARAIAAIKVTGDECQRAGGQMLLWEGRTLEARLLIRRGGKGDAVRALATLPKPETMKPYDNKTLVSWYYQGLAFLLEAHKATEAKDFNEARKITEALTLHGNEMAKHRNVASKLGERSLWFRALNGLALATAESRGLQVMAGPAEGYSAAFNWYSAALDRQSMPAMLMPPVMMMPMEGRLADYHLARGDGKAATDILVAGLAKHPRDLELLTRLRSALIKAKHADQANEIAEEIEAVKAQ